MTSSFRAAFIAIALCPATTRADAALPMTRTFRFTYAVTVAGLPPGQAAQVWLPVPPSDEDQVVTMVGRQLPGEPKLGKEPKYGNQMLFIEARADDDGAVPLSVTYRVQRHAVQADARSKSPSAAEVKLFLRPDARVPITGKPLALIADKQLPADEMELARVLYDTVNGHMRYSKEGIGWGRGDAVWACDSRFGNCSDFHSLFISLARSRRIPARFEIGFPLPPKRGRGEVAGYHCWAKFRPAGRGWVPVDISEANKNPQLADYYFGNLTPDRVTFSIGRDLTLVPKQNGPPLNFFVYPYVEVAGQPYPAEKMRPKFAFEDEG